MLTKEEELELQSLEAEEAGINPLNVVESAAQGATLSLGDELGAGINAGLDVMGVPGSGSMGNESFGQAYDRRLGSTSERMNEFSQEHPIVDIAAKMAGGGTLGAGKTLLQQAAVQAGLGGVESFGASEDKFTEEGAIDTTIGTGVAGGLSLLLGKLGRPARKLEDASTMSGRVSNKIGDVAERAETIADRRLITRAAETQNPVAKAVEAAQETIPLASDAPRIRNNLRKELNKAASESVGIPNPKGESLANTLDEARSFNSAAYKSVLDNTKIELPIDINTSLAEIINEDIKALGSSRDATNIVKKAMTRIANEIGADGKMGGKALQELRSEALAISRKAAASSDPNSSQLGKTVDKLVKVLDESIYTGLPDDDARMAWRKANEQFKAIKALEVRGVIHPATGDVSPHKLYSSLDKQFNGQIPQSHLADLTLLGKAPGMANSGTATRQLFGKLLTGGAGAGAVGASAAGLGFAPVASLAGSIGTSRGLSQISEHVPASMLGLLGGTTARSLDE